MYNALHLKFTAKKKAEGFEEFKTSLGNIARF